MRRVRPEWVPPPHAAHIITTFKCNLKCIGCGSWEVRDHEDLTLDQWLPVFKQLESLDIVKILGGEPFVRKDIVGLLAAVRDEIDPYILQLGTNGMLTDRIVEALDTVGWPGLQLRISVDGTAAVHDRIRGVEGSWDQVDHTVRKVAELKQKRGFQFGINFAVTDDSLGDFEAMVEYAESVGADLIPGVNVDPFLVGTTPPEIRQQEIILLSNADEGLRRIEDHRVGTRTELPLVDHLLSRFMTMRTFERQIARNDRSFPCRELRDLIYMLPNGDVVRCGMDHEPVGNVLESSIEEIWYGDRVEPHRRKVEACPGCMQASVQIMSRLYGGCLDA